jgi:hypothetical protein
MLDLGISEGDPLAAHTPRELDLSDTQRAHFVDLLTRVLPKSDASMRVEVAASLHVLTGSTEWSAVLVEVLAAPLFWSVRIDAAIRLAAFPPTDELVAAAARGVRDPEYLVRYHCANTLLRWAGRTEEISDDPALFPRLAADDDPSGWAAVAQALAAAVEP